MDDKNKLIVTHSRSRGKGPLLPCSAHARQCDICDDVGYIIYSCCGNDITDTINESDLCPTCLEHCGEGDKEICECKEEL